jgi:hypothetical protein
MICNCCGQRINRYNVDPDHVYRLGVFVEYAPRKVARVGTQHRAVCRLCVARIEKGHELRSVRGCR